jgi:hypothetical protein
MKYTREQFINLAKKVYGKKYTYDNLGYSRMNDPIYNVTCPIHGGFSISSASNFIHRNTACHTCNIKNSKRKQIWNTDWFVKRSKEVHGEEYDYSKVDYKRNTTKVIIICPTHGEFQTLPSNHARGSICPKCAIKESRKKRLLTKEVFIEKAIRVHGERYDYTDTKYSGRLYPITIGCPIHGLITIKRASQHLRGQGCPQCKQK